MPQDLLSQDSNTKDTATKCEDFEKLIDKAKETLSKLSAQEITLKESIELYQQGMDSLKSAQDILESARLKYKEIKE